MAEQAGMEIVVVAHRESAEHAGFRNGRHQQNPHIMAWWPGRGERHLPVGRVVSRVTIDSRVALSGEARAHLRAVLERSGPDGIWMEF